jgi:hypothetical protein
MRRYHDSDRLDVIVINRGGGPLTVLNVYYEDSPMPGIGIKVGWVPDDGSLPVTIGGGSAVDWHPELPEPVTMVLAGVPFGERFFKVPAPGWEGRDRRFRRGEVFGGLTKELKGQRNRPTPEKPLKLR